MSGFRNDQDKWISKCPSCGKFVAEDDAYYCREFNDDENVAAFCNPVCADGYPAPYGYAEAGTGVYAGNDHALNAELEKL